MKNTYIIQDASTSGGLNFLLDKSRVTKTLFNYVLDTMVKEITAKEPEKFEETKQLILDNCVNNNGVTVRDFCFMIKPKP